MKKTMLLLLVTAFISIQGYSQENKGKFLVGGTVSLSLSDSDSEYTNRNYNRNSQYFSLEVPAGYFISNSFLVGIKSAYSYQISNSGWEYIDRTTEQETKNDLFSVGPFLRYYNPIISKLNFFLDLTVTYGFGKENSKSFENEVLQYENDGKLWRIYADLSPGLSYQVSNWLFFDATFGRLTYFKSHYKPNEDSENDSEDERSNFNFIFNNFSFGLSARLGK
jgi:hypothetical protein